MFCVYGYGKVPRSQKRIRSRHVRQRLQWTALEKTSISITRLKRCGCWMAVVILCVLKRQVSRLRDWNFTHAPRHHQTTVPWKDKYLDYEIETKAPRACLSVKRPKLEKTSISITRLKRGCRGHTTKCISLLEKTSISITRLKQSRRVWTPKATRRVLKRQVSRLRDWNRSWFGSFQSPNNTWKDKYLDYEIETSCNPFGCGIYPSLEKTSISITRLKRGCGWSLKTNILPWKDKYLDYEIETIEMLVGTHACCHTWKDKYLDYEIETYQNQ